MLEQYLIELGIMLSRIENEMQLKPITKQEMSHYLQNHYGNSFIKTLYRDHQRLLSGKSDEIIPPEIEEYEGSGGNTEDQRVMSLADLVY